MLKNNFRKKAILVIAITLIMAGIGIGNVVLADNPIDIENPSLVNPTLEGHFIECYNIGSIEAMAKACVNAGYPCPADLSDYTGNLNDYIDYVCAEDSSVDSYTPDTYTANTCNASDMVLTTGNYYVTKILCYGTPSSEYTPKIASVSSGFIAGILDIVDDTFNSIYVLIVLVIGLPLAFWFIRKAMDLVKLKR